MFKITVLCGLAARSRGSNWFANGFANHRGGQPRMLLDKPTAYIPSEQACLTAMDWSGQLESCTDLKAGGLSLSERVQVDDR
jgi:hypothetical protein